LDSDWSYSKIYTFLESHFKFLFQYFAKGPNAELYDSDAEPPFLVVSKSRQSLEAVPCELLDLNGETLLRNLVIPLKKGQRTRKLFLGMLH